MTTHANSSPVETVLARLDAVKRSGTGWIARCPAHKDGRPSLKIDVGDDGRALLNCYARCAPSAIVDAIGLSLADLFIHDDRPSGPTLTYASGERITYDYHDATGAVIFQVVRNPGKRFSQRRPDGHGGWIANLNGVDRCLYHKNELATEPDRWIALCEGEKDSDRLRSLGLLATTVAGGSNAPWLDHYSETLRDRAVTIFADNDPSGIACAQSRAQALWGIARRVKVVLLPDLPAKGDVSDWLDAGHTKTELIQILKDTPDWTPEDAAGAEPMDAALSPLVPALITADALMRKVFPEPRWAVPGIFPEGLSLLVGAPKLGKSWLGLNVAVSIALGGRAIGKIEVDGGDVLYLALEDTERRLQERLAITLQGADAPARLHIATTWPMLADGAAEHLSGWLASHPDARLVIVDTFQKLRGPIPGNQNQYAGDYAAAGELKRVADRFGVALVCVHHTRKASADDPLDMVSGTAGLAGAADTTCVLQREIGRHDATLYIRGRDVPEADHALSFDATTCAWTLLGDADTYRVSEERQEILDVLRDAIAPMSPKHIAEALGKKDGAVRFLLHKMAKSGDVDGVGGAYRLPLPPTNSANTANDHEDYGESVSAVSGVSGGDTPRCVQCGQPVDTPGALYCDQHGGASPQPIEWPHTCTEPGCQNRCTPPHKYRCDDHIRQEAA